MLHVATVRESRHKFVLAMFSMYYRNVISFIKTGIYLD